MFRIALYLNLVFIATALWASYRHFDRDEAQPAGARALTLATGIGTVANIWFAYHSPRDADWANFAALTLAVLAFAVFLAALHATWKGGLSLAFSESTPPAVIDGGIYGVIRHPFYCAYCLYWLSWVPLTSLHPGAILVAGAMIASYIVAVRKEERHLIAGLGEAYRSLMRRTWRFLPGVH